MAFPFSPNLDMNSTNFVVGEVLVEANLGRAEGVAANLGAVGEAGVVPELLVDLDRGGEGRQRRHGAAERVAAKVDGLVLAGFQHLAQSLGEWPADAQPRLEEPAVHGACGNTPRARVK